MASAVATRTLTHVARRSPAPSFHVERACWEAGDRLVCGMDEVGRGAWAGPVSVGALVAPYPRRISRVRDSKLLTVEEREALYPKIAGWAVAFAIGHASSDECDALGMTAALRLAGRRALASLAAQGLEPDRIILDGPHDYLGLGPLVRTLVDGDALCLSVAAASVLAKVTRDRLMAEEADCYPGYDFDSNRGYPSPRHQCALLGYGPTAIHRRSWIYMDNLPWLQAGPAQATLFG